MQNKSCCVVVSHHSVRRSACIFISVSLSIHGCLVPWGQQNKESGSIEFQGLSLKVGNNFQKSSYSTKMTQIFDIDETIAKRLRDFGYQWLHQYSCKWKSVPQDLPQCKLLQFHPPNQTAHKNGQWCVQVVYGLIVRANPAAKLRLLREGECGEGVGRHIRAQQNACSTFYCFECLQVLSELVINLKFKLGICFR